MPQLVNAVICLVEQATNECDHERILEVRTPASTLFMAAFFEADRADGLASDLPLAKANGAAPPVGISSSDWLIAETDPLVH